MTVPGTLVVFFCSAAFGQWGQVAPGTRRSRWIPRSARGHADATRIERFGPKITLVARTPQSPFVPPERHLTVRMPSPPAPIFCAV